MSLNQYVQAVQNVFEKDYPRFWWDDYFLDDEKARLEQFLKNEHHAGNHPKEALTNLFRTFGRL